MITIGLLLLFVEILKATRVGKLSIVDRNYSATLFLLPLGATI